MNEKNIKEIDVVDLLIDWLSHWRSILIFLLVGTVLAGGYLYLGRGDEIKPIEDEKISLEKMESDVLSEKDIIVVNELIDLENNYRENVEEYQNQKDSLSIKDRTEAFEYITDTKNILEARKLSLTEEQQGYYYAKLDVDTKAGGADESNMDNQEAFAGGASKKKAVLLIILLAIIHFLVFACRYIFDKKVKYADKLSKMLSVPEFTRLIDWDAIDRKKGLDKFINKLRFSSYRRTSLSDVLDINVKSTVEKLKNREYDSVAVVGFGLNDEREEFKSRISRFDSSIIVKSIDSITHSVNGADDIIGVKAAIIAVRVGVTLYNDLYEELQSLRDRDVDVIGIAVFE